MHCLPAAILQTKRLRPTLLQAPAVPMVRRHTRSSDGDAFHFAPTIRVVSGNYVTGKRRGVIDGVDFCATGECMLPPAASSILWNSHDDHAVLIPRRKCQQVRNLVQYLFLLAA